MVKLASPRWAKLLGQLSQQSRDKLQTILPKGVTRQIGKKELGRGVEGRVYPGFTGGRGDSAIKVFNDRPARRFFDQYSAEIPHNKFKPGVHAVLNDPSVGRITGGAGNARGMLGGFSINDRAALMRQHPEIFPKIFGQHGRGYVMEPLRDMTLQQHVPSRAVQALSRQLSSLSNSTKNPLSNHYMDLSARLPSSGAHPQRIRIQDFGYRPGGAASNRTNLSTSNASGYHNLMRTRDGRAVISDPVLSKSPQQYTTNSYKPKNRALSYAGVTLPM